MTASTPTILHADPARTADELRTPAGGIDPTAALVQGLEQTPAASASVSPIVAFVVGLLTFGMVPLWLWHHRLREHILDQQAQLRRTAAWLAWKTGRAEALDLRRLADEAGWRGAIGLASLICLPVILCFLFLYFTRVGALDLHTLLAITYRFGSRHHWSLPGTPAGQFFLLWTTGLCLGYMVHWAHLQGHIADLSRYTAALNRLLAAEGQPPLTLGRVGTGLRPLPVIGAVLLLNMGAVWGIPMMLAASGSRVYARRIPRRFAHDLAQRIRAIAAGQRSGTLLRSCRRPRCGTILPDDAQFCPRCGLAVRGAVNQVA